MSDYNLYEIDQMDGHSFEYFCADVLNRNGFSNVTVTKGSGDYGIDILAERNGQSFAIQCKRYNGRIGNKAVQEALSGCVYYGYDIPVVLTNSYFTEQAKETARRTNVELWDRETLMSFISTAYPSNAAFKYSSRQASKSNPKTSSSNPGCGKTILGLIIVVIFFSVISSLFKSCFGSKTEEPENTSSISSVQNTTASVDESTNQSNTTFDTPEASTKPVEETPFISRTVEENNVVYEISGDNATVLGLADSGTTLTHIEVLGEIEGTPVTSIADEAFNWCENLEEINLPGSITSIGKWAFRECTSLKHITIPNGVTAIESTTFSDCRSLTYIDLPEGLTSIGYDAFWNCGFSEIELPTSLESIDSSAFCACGNLISITIPEGTVSIGKAAFKFCDSLRSISLPSTLEEIGNNCFWGCTSLTSITIPENVTELKALTFANDDALQTIYIPEGCKIPGGEYPFSACNLNLQIIRY